MILVVAAAGLGYYMFYFQSSGGDARIVTSGHIEVTEVDMSFRLSGHVVKIHVEEGDQVKEGAPLAELDKEILAARLKQSEAKVRELEARHESLELAVRIKEDVLRAEVKRARASVNAASARYQSLKTGSRDEEIAEAAAARDRAKTEWENRKKDFVRIRDLHERRIVSTSTYDAALTGSEAARAAHEAAEERYKLIKAGPRREKILEGRADLSGSGAALKAAEAGSREVEKMRLDIKALEAQTDQARAGLLMARDDVAKASLHAPFRGFVIVKDVETREFVQAGTPVLTLARLDRVWVRTYVPETQMGRVYLGQEAHVRSDSFPEKLYPGQVTYVSPEAEFTPKNVQTKEERVKLVYRIKVSLDNPEQELKAGMPVDVSLR